MTTVLLLNPCGLDILPFVNGTPGIKQVMKGTIGALGTVEKIPYTNQPGIANIIAGTATLHTRLTSGRAPGETFVVFGYSEGCQIGSRWLRLHGPDLDIAPADIEFIFVGNATRKYGGFVYQQDVFDTVADVEGYPDATPYQVTDFVRQYDSIGDFPQAPAIQTALNSVAPGTNPSYLVQAIQNILAVLSNADLALAVENAVDGALLIHNDYFDVTLTDPQNVTKFEGNVTYIWSPTAVLPKLAGWWWLPTYQKQLDKEQRPKVEKAYNRPVTLADPNYKPPKPVTRRTGLVGDDRTVAAQAEVLAVQKSALDMDWVVEVTDKLVRPVGEVGDDLMELTGTDPRNNLPSATLKMKGDADLVPIMMGCRDTLVGVTVETQGLRFPFYVDTHDYEFQKGEWTSTANLKGIWDILNFLVIWPEWFLPIWAQPISHAVYIGPLCSVIESMIAECALRIQSGFNEFLNNAGSLNFDMRTWFGALLQSNGNIATMLKTPIYVVRTNPFLDTSPLYARTVRMETCAAVIQDITRAYGVDVRVDLWKVGDDQPDEWANLDQPTYVVTVKDRSQIEGPTKTILDSVIRTVVDIQGSLLGKALDPLLNPQGEYSPEGVFIAPTLGVNFVPPWTILEASDPGQKGNVVSAKISDHTPKGWQHIVGGRSPKWLNDLMNATYAWIIDSLSILIGFSGIPSNLLEGFMNNAFLAFQLLQSYDRRNDVGPYHPAIEVMHATASSPYNVETLFAFINALWDSRGWTSAQVTFRNGEVYTLGKDVFRGGLVSVVYHNRTKLLTDYIENVLFRITPTDRDVLCQVGDGKPEESPLAKHQRLISGVLEAVTVLTLSPQS